MYPDVECPYCEKGVDIDHDDGYGYQEDRTFMQECEYCGNTFSYTTSISYYHEAAKAPCQNGGPHDWKPMNSGYPTAFFVGMERCSFCDIEECHDVEGRKKAIELYKEEMSKK